MRNLIEALQIFCKYKDLGWPTHCEHDILMIMGVTKDEVSEEDQKRGIIKIRVSLMKRKPHKSRPAKLPETEPCVGRKGTKEVPDCGPYCGLCQGTGRVAKNQPDPIVSLEEALKLRDSGLPQCPGYASYYYGNAGTYSGTVVPGEMYLDIDLDWYGTKLLAAPTMTEITEVTIRTMSKVIEATLKERQEASEQLTFAYQREAQTKLDAIKELLSTPDGSVVVESCAEDVLCEPYVLVSTLREILGES